MVVLWQVCAGFSSQRPLAGLPGGARVLKDNLPAKVEMRSRILQLHNDRPDLSIRAIAASLGCTRWNVHHTINSNTTVVGQRGGARRFAISQDDKRRFIRLVVGELINGWREGGMSLRSAVIKWNADDDEKTTVRRSSAVRWLHQDGYDARVPRVGGNIQEPNIVQRHRWWDRNHKHTANWWLRMCFSDSTQVQYVHIPIARNERVYARAGDKIHPLRKRRRPKKSLHTYAVLTKWGLVGPFFIDGIITAHRYLAILRRMLDGITDIYRRKRDPSRWIFMQDGAGPHTADRTQLWLRNNEYSFWTKAEWPGNSPDLNPIEGFWAILQAYCTPPGTDQMLSNDELRRRVIRWFALDHQLACRKALRGMRGRCDELETCDFEAIDH